MNYKNHVGDGKFPNRYWVFHYDEKFNRKNDELVPIQEANEIKDSLLGEFKTYREALQCVDNKAFYPHIVIEDRLSGQVFESICIVCPCCKKEDYETYHDIKYTEKAMKEKGYKFE